MTDDPYPLHAIRTEADFKQALALIEAYFDMTPEPDPDSDEGAHFDALATLIEAYEAKHYPIAPPDPIDAIRFRMDQQGLSVHDLEPMIGRANRVYAQASQRPGHPSRGTDLGRELTRQGLQRGAESTHTPLTLAQMADLADAFSQSDLPIQVDLVDWASAQPGIRQAIERDKVVVWRAVQAN